MKSNLSKKSIFIIALVLTVGVFLLFAFSAQVTQSQIDGEVDEHMQNELPDESESDQSIPLAPIDFGTP